MIEVLQPGLLTTVQDLGRQRLAHLGISAAGAGDPLALRIGNLLVGNPEDAAALEFTLSGGAFLFHATADVALTGAAHGGSAASGSSFRVRSGDTLTIQAATTGARGYLCVAGGGIVVPKILGSASTHLPSSLGGHYGRALRKGDRLAFHCTRSTEQPRSIPARFDSLLERRHRIRVTEGPHASQFSGDATSAFAASSFRVQPDSNRQGLRLASSAPIAYPGEILSEGVPLGAIQILLSGAAIILFVDSQTTGGYPVIASVISADLPSVGQLRPGDRIQFVPVTMTQAIAALREQEALLDALRQEFT